MKLFKVFLSVGHKIDSRKMQKNTGNLSNVCRREEEETKIPVIVTYTEYEIGVPSSNSGLDRCIYLRRNNLDKCMNSPIFSML